MKRFLIAGITLLLLFALASCGEPQGGLSEPSETTLSSEALSVPNDGVIACGMEPSLSFASLEDLSNGCIAAREGRDITSFVLNGRGLTESTMADIAEEINLAALDKFYLPTNVPEPYRLHYICVAKGSVGIRYLREEDLISEDPERPLRIFAYTYSRSDFDSPLNDRMQQYGVTKDDLIDGKYLFNENSFTLDWEFDGRLMSLYLPTSREVWEEKISLIEYLGLNSVEDLAQFTEVELINLA